MADPIEHNLTLTRGADFAYIFEKAASDSPFPEGTTARIEISEKADTTSTIVATWTANQITDDHIKFWVQSDDADVIPARYRYRLMVQYPIVVPETENLDFCWYRGAFKRKD